MVVLPILYREQVPPRQVPPVEGRGQYGDLLSVPASVLFKMEHL